MSRESFERKKPRVYVGTIGHVSARGKTLVSILNGKMKAKGIEVEATEIKLRSEANVYKLTAPPDFYESYVIPDTPKSYQAIHKKPHRGKYKRNKKAGR